MTRNIDEIFLNLKTGTADRLYLGGPSFTADRQLLHSNITEFVSFQFVFRARGSFVASVVICLNWPQYFLMWNILWKSDFPEENPHHITSGRRTQLVSQWPTKVLPAEQPTGVYRAVLYSTTVQYSPDCSPPLHWTPESSLQSQSFCNTTSRFPITVDCRLMEMILDNQILSVFPPRLFRGSVQGRSQKPPQGSWIYFIYILYRPRSKIGMAWDLSVNKYINIYVNLLHLEPTYHSNYPLRYI